MDKAVSVAEKIGGECKSAFAIAFYSVRKRMTSPRVICIFVMFGVYIWSNMSFVPEITEMLGLRINPVLFPFFFQLPYTAACFIFRHRVSVFRRPVYRRKPAVCDYKKQEDNLGIGSNSAHNYVQRLVLSDIDMLFHIGRAASCHPCNRRMGQGDKYAGTDQCRQRNKSYILYFKQDNVRVFSVGGPCLLLPFELGDDGLFGPADICGKPEIR